MMSNDRHCVYKSLETDTEFSERVRARIGFAPFQRGAGLDDYVWHATAMQRRIVERSTDPVDTRRTRG